jgi:hypothetical protein
MALLHVLVRLVHVAGMAVLLGGAVLAWAQLRTGTDDPLATAAAYEWLFWGAVGLVVLTGVGNLGAMAPAVPGPGTDWGLTFAVKLAGVVGLLAGSLVRTLAVARWRALVDGSRERPRSASRERLPAVYAATAGYLLALVALAEVLAHG